MLDSSYIYFSHMLSSLLFLLNMCKHTHLALLVDRHKRESSTAGRTDKDMHRVSIVMTSTGAGFAALKIKAHKDSCLVKM